MDRSKVQIRMSHSYKNNNHYIHEQLSEWIKTNQAMYAEGYFERGEGSGYINYSWKPELITPFIKGIIKRSGIKKGAKVLDFGCAKGFYIKILLQMGFDPIGIDISKYALAQSPGDIRERLFLQGEHPLELFEPGYFDLTIAKDVLEHIPEFALDYSVNQLKRISKKIFMTVPFCNENRKYINNGDEIDLTHRIRYTMEEWIKLLGSCIQEDELCRIIKRDKSKGTLCCIVSCENSG
jgi:2-polyprenyl-3-methyl-5-hydroxy-6-metoxy-1,4-benzoquinol methylase